MGWFRSLLSPIKKLWFRMHFAQKKNNKSSESDYNKDEKRINAMGSLPTEPFQPLDLNLFSKESKLVVDFIADYYRDIESFPVRSQVKPGYLRNLIPDTPPLFPSPITTILHDIKTDIFPGLTHWQSPNFYAYYQANASSAGFAGEMLCSGLNVVGFSWIAYPAATELETIVMDWMANMLKLPPTFLSGGLGGGVIHGSTCEAVVCTLAAARDNALSQSNGEGITKLTVYASDQTHFTFQKAAKLVGIPARNFRVISIDVGGDRVCVDGGEREGGDEC
ncbi:Tyrosine/DOPA decarboxylase 2 [Dendrobium catenatum]|uniref:Tyrosine/DOPA decarboxylase 2 n=1 Tax=Dendrobium catenatum TaxID=906689 RepID=A0A2I0XJM4_9ASPA|nr:Tyrosine/DOPA decarboxylase 2 [Dendrobium catenatum]